MKWDAVLKDPVPAVRRLMATRDPAGRTITQQWCICGSNTAYRSIQPIEAFFLNVISYF